MKKLIFNLLIIASFVEVHAQVPSYVPLNSLQAWYNLFDYNDSSGNDNHLSELGSAPILTTDRFNIANSAYLFSLGNRLVRDIPSFEFNHLDDFSISLWINSTSSNGVCLFSGDDQYDNFITLIGLDNSNINFGLNQQGIDWFFLNTPSNSDQWQHVVGLYSNGEMKIYKNAVLINTLSFTYEPTSTILPFFLGGDHNSGNYSGKIDDVGVWNRALTPTEVLALYESNLSSNSFDQNSFSFFPNPMNDALNISNPNNVIIDNLKITDVNGKILLDIQNPKNSVVVSHLSSGFYFVTLEFGNEKFVSKFVKN